MKIHEYQGKELFKSFGVPVPQGYAALNKDDAIKAYKNLKTEKAVIKAQIHAGGRGKGGGVKLVNSLTEAEEQINNILGMNLITHQTGPEGKIVQRLLIEEASDISRELYAGIVLDRNCGQFVFMVSSEGGVEIEKIAKETPEKIIKEWVKPNSNLKNFQARKLAFALGLSVEQIKYAVNCFLNLWTVFKKYDCSLMEINPLVVTSSNEVIALDAKINFDDNALYRHKNIEKMRDTSEENPAEVEADSFNLNYIKLDGNVGCMVNGAGLAMGTMDIIKLYGGEPANFLDVGGVANAETVAKGFKIILSDKNVRSILINIFGGIVRCDRVAQGVIDALTRVDVSVPVIVRLEGTNAPEARELLKNAEHKFIVANSLSDAAKKSVKATGEI
jgi:succinyl-CoA synthetase beta subunit